MDHSQEINQLKRKIQSQQEQFQSYKTQCKQLEEFLEAESEKKEAEIRKLKEDAIKREKTTTTLKTQCSQYEAEIAQLKSELRGSLLTQSSPQIIAFNKKITDLQQQNKKLKQENENLKDLIDKDQELKRSMKQKISTLEQTFKNKAHYDNNKGSLFLQQSSTNQPNSFKGSMFMQETADIKNNQDVKQLQFQIKKLKAQVQTDAYQKKSYKQKINDLENKIKVIEKNKNSSKITNQINKKESKHLQELSSSKGSMFVQQEVDYNIPLQNKETKTQIEKLKTQIQRDLQQKKSMKQKINQLEQKLTNSQNGKINQKKTGQFHQYQTKIKNSQNQIQKLKSQISNLKIKNTKLSVQCQNTKQEIIRLYQENKDSKKRIQFETPSKLRAETDQIYQPRYLLNHSSNNKLVCSLILTKRHYLSPFLEIRNNQMKLFKNNKNGFEKSLGALKYKMDLISYEIQPIVQKVIQNVKGINQTPQNIQYCLPDSIILIGNKRTSKKYIMAELINRLKDKIMDFVVNTQCNVSMNYLIRSLQQQKNQTHQANTKQQIEDLFQLLSKMGEKKSLKSSKNNSKSKIRYFSCKINQYMLQIITTSHTQNILKDNISYSEALNQVIYYKMPDVLQLAQANRQLVITLNPIVQYYEDCKNSLSLLLCKNQQKTIDWDRQSPSKEDLHQNDLYLNNIIKRRMDYIERQNQQNGLRLKKLESQCDFYRRKFQQLQIRLKGLLNTHYAQNSYLKKSPTAMSYEKLLKYVNSVLGRNHNDKTLTNSPRLTQNIDIQQQQELPI